MEEEGVDQEVVVGWGWAAAVVAGEETGAREAAGAGRPATGEQRCGVRVGVVGLNAGKVK